MSFPDPQSVTVNAVAQSLPNISREAFASQYRKDDGTYSLKVNHSEGKRNRRTVRLDFQKVAADPFEPALNQKFTGSVYVVIDAPITGFTNTEIKDITLGLTGWLSSANVLKVLGGES
jgi:hypothetical protein